MKRQKRLFESAAKKQKNVRLHERVISDVVEGNIDEKAGVIRRCKLLGTSSLNNRVYEETARKKAAGLYENCPVRIDHKPDEFERPIIDDIGVLRNITEEGGGVYGDFHYLTTHPLADTIVERARRFPESFGFSHQADGLVEVRDDGVEHVVDIVSVESVDLVNRPATNKSLFEQEERPMKVKKTFRKIVWGVPKDNPVRQRILESEDKISDDIMSMEVMVEPDATPIEEMEAALQSAISAILQNADLSTEEKLQEIASLVGGAAVPEEEDEEEEEVSESEDDEEEELTEGSAQEDIPNTTPTPKNPTPQQVAEAIEKSINKALKPVVERLQKVEKTQATHDQRLTESQKRSRVTATFEAAGIINPEPEDVEAALQLKGPALTRFVERVQKASDATAYTFPRSSGDGSSEPTHGYDRIAKAGGLAKFLKG